MKLVKLLQKKIEAKEYVVNDPGTLDLRVIYDFCLKNKIKYEEESDFGDDNITMFAKDKIQESLIKNFLKKEVF